MAIFICRGNKMGDLIKKQLAGLCLIGQDMFRPHGRLVNELIQIRKFPFRMAAFVFSQYCFHPITYNLLTHFTVIPEAVSYYPTNLYENEKRDVLSQIPRNHSRRFMASKAASVP